MIFALEKGKNGERYLLASQHQTTSTQLFDLAATYYPKIKKPPALPKSLLYLIASAGEFASKFTGKQPPLLRSWIKLYHQIDYSCDISKAEKELGFCPGPPETALLAAMKCIAEHENLN